MQWLSEYYQYVLVFIALLILTVFLIFKSGKAYSSHQKTFKALEKEMKELSFLKQKYKNFTAESLAECPDEEILKGVATVYEAFFAKSENANEAFLGMNEHIQNIYVLNAFVSDGSLKKFFSESDDFLRLKLTAALKMIGETELAEKFSSVQKMYDKNDETTSFDEREIEKADLYIAENDILRKIKVASAEYIRQNAEILKI